MMATGQEIEVTGQDSHHYNRKPPAWIDVDNLPYALVENDMMIRGKPVPCAVLPNGDRLLTQRGFSEAMGRHKNPNRKASIDERPVFLPGNLDPFTKPEVWDLVKPVYYRSNRPGGFWGNIAIGYRAELLPLVCFAYIDADEADALRANQRPIAEVCRDLIRSFAVVGIIALVDEATGYQDIRERIALQRILDRWLVKTDEWRRWSREFPIDFYREMFRLRGWEFDESNSKRPGVVGHWTNDLVYDRLAPNLLAEMKLRVPRNPQGKPKTKLFLGLTEEHGLPELRQYLHTIVAMMRGSQTWGSFYRLVDRSFPRLNSTNQLALFDPED